jgi:hypothetical protein
VSSALKCSLSPFRPRSPSHLPSLTQRSNLITSFLIGPTHHQGQPQPSNRPIRLFAMADIADPNAQNSPAAQDDATGNGNGADNRGVKRPRVSTAADDDDDDDDKPGRERRKIDIKFIQDKSRRHITFSKRKAGIMKKVRSASFPKLTQAHCSSRRHL